MSRSGVALAMRHTGLCTGSTAYDGYSTSLTRISYFGDVPIYTSFTV